LSGTSACFPPFLSSERRAMFLPFSFFCFGEMAVCRIRTSKDFSPPGGFLYGFPPALGFFPFPEKSSVSTDSGSETSDRHWVVFSPLQFEFGRSLEECRTSLLRDSCLGCHSFVHPTFFSASPSHVSSPLFIFDCRVRSTSP